MDKVLILTGMAGFIGMNFLNEMIKDKKFLELYKKIISIDKMGYATQYNKYDYYNICKSNDINVLDTNINNINSWDNSNIRNVKCDIVDLSSESHVDNSIRNPYGIFTENSSIPVSLISWVGIDNIDRYIHISTDEIFGDLPLTASVEEWFDINSPLHPNNPYSASKASQDCFLMSLKHTFGLNLQIIRLANQFGPYQFPEKLLPATICRAKQGQSIKIYGKGLNKRQWTPVVDSVKIIMDVARGNIKDDILHIATKEELIPNNNEVVEIWRNILLKDFKIDTKIEYIEDRKGHDLMYALKTTDIVKTYFTTSNEVRFKETIEYYINNVNLYTKD